MATNINNGKGGNMSFNSNPEVQSGISGYFQGRSAQSFLTNNFYKEGGYLESSIKELEEAKKLYEEMSKLNVSMTRAEKTALREKKRELKQQLDILYTQQSVQDTSSDEAIESIKTANKLRLQGLSQYQKLLLRLSEDERENADIYKEKLEQIQKTYTLTKSNTAKINNDLDKTKKVLDKASNSFSKSLSETLSSAGNGLEKLSNMFNLNKIAQFTDTFDAKNKANIMGSINRQFGFNNNSQFEQFKNSLVSEVQDLNRKTGYLFNRDDLREYMSKLDDFNITNRDMAIKQAQNALIAQKYLGTSDETMTKMFKYMKMTNNNDIIEDFNKSTIAIMKSQLGVSEQQLDELRKSNFDLADAITELGGDGGVFIQDWEKLQSALIDSGVSQSAVDMITKEFGRILQQGYKSGYDINTLNALNSAFKNGNAADALTALVNSNQFNQGYSLYSNQGNLFTGSAIRESLSNAGVWSEYNAGLFTAIKNNPNLLSEALGKYRNVNEAEENLTQEDIEKALKDSQPLNFIQRIMNKFSTDFEKLPWGPSLALADAAFALYLSSGLVKGLGNFISGFKDGGGLAGGLKQMIGIGSPLAKATAETASATSGLSSTAGSVLGKLAVGGIVVGLTVAAIKGIADANRAGMNRVFNESYDKTMSELKGTSLEGNTSYASAASIQEAVDSQTGFGSGMGNLWSGTSYGFKKLFTKSKSELNTALTQWMYESGALKGVGNILAWAFMLDKVGSLDSYNNATGASFNKSNLYDILTKSGYDSNYINKKANEILKAGWLPYTDNKGGRMREFSLDLSGYHKAGLDYVPKDNYKALLHKGEMVLNEREANLLRDAMNMTNMGGVEAGWYSVDDGRRGGSYPRKITSAYREKRSSGLGYHTGVDFAFPMGTPIGAAQDGKIDQSYFNSSYGNMIREKFNNGKYAIYAHQSKRVAKVGDKVKVGDLLGYSGSTGHSTGPHLHFEVRNSTRYGDDTDPLKFVTQGLFRTGTASLAGSSGVSSENSSSDSSSEAPQITVSSGRFVPKAFSSSGGQGGDVGRIVNSVDGGFDKLINYLNGIREEQQAQREILNAFSQSRPGEY